MDILGKEYEYKLLEDDNKACLELMKNWACNGFPEDSPFKQLILDTLEDTTCHP